MVGLWLLMISLAESLFSTVPAHDYLQFWQAGRFQPQRVVRFLALSKEDVARLAGVAVSSVRFDGKAPRGLTDRLSEIAATCTLVAQFFEGNAIKTGLWFKTANPMIGDESPRDMIRQGRHEQLQKFVMDALSEARRPATMTRLAEETGTAPGAADGEA